MTLLDRSLNKWIVKEADKLLTGVEDWVEDAASHFVHWLGQSSTWHSVVSVVKEAARFVHSEFLLNSLCARILLRYC